VDPGLVIHKNCSRALDKITRITSGSTIGWWSPGNGRGRFWAQQVAVTPGYGLDQRQGPGFDRPESSRRRSGRDRRGSQPRAAGLGRYFRQGNSSAKFGAVDSYVHERMARLASRKYGIRGFNWSDRFTWGWLGDLGIYRLTGTVRYPTAHARR